MFEKRKRHGETDVKVLPWSQWFFVIFWAFIVHCNAPINSNGAHQPPPPPLPLPGNRGTFAHVVSPGEVALANFNAARGLGIRIPRGDPWAFDTCFRKIEEFIGKDEDFVKDWLVRQGLEKPADVFKGCRTLADFLS